MTSLREPEHRWLILRCGLFFLLLFGPSILMVGEAARAESPVEAQEFLQVIVQGLEGEELKNAQAVLALPPGLVREGKVDQLWLVRFQTQAPEKIRQALEPFGYYHPQIKVSLETPDGEVYQLHIKVERGEPVRVKSIKVLVQGPGLAERRVREQLKTFPLKEGDVLDHRQYEEAKGNLRREALDLGYLDADFSAHVIRVSRAEYSAEIELILETGPRYYFGEVRIEGAPEYPERFLRRYLAFHSGEAFSSPKIFQTQLNFNNSDRFREVIIIPEKDSATDSRVPVQIKLSPSRPKRLRFGIGYGTDTGARGTANYRDLNFKRWGHEWHAELNLSERFQGLVTRYVLPSLSDLGSFTSLKAGLQKEEARTFESRAISFEFEHTRSLGRGKLGSGYFQMRREDFEVGMQKGRSRLMMPGLRFNERRYDDLVRPRKGYRYALELRGTDEFLGSDTGFLQFLFEGDLILPLPLEVFLLARGQGGFTLLSDPLRDLPPSVRFFAGGDRSIRGYAYQSLGPRDASGKVIGGKHLLVGSVELERRIAKIWGVAAFYDAGNAFNNFGKIDVQQGVGVGLRLYTPVGPIRLDLARQVGVKDPDFRIHLTVGFGL
jgi:translocation and assembly module TamA